MTIYFINYNFIILNIIKYYNIIFIEFLCYNIYIKYYKNINLIILYFNHGMDRSLNSLSFIQHYTHIYITYIQHSISINYVI